MKWVLEDNHGCDDLPHAFEPKDREAIESYVEVFKWCEAEFGGERQRPNRWYAYARILHFRSHADAIAFKLRWG